MKDWLFLIEAVTSHGPISEKRIFELEQMLGNCKSRKRYVTIFPSMSIYEKYATNIALDTEIWFANNPDRIMYLHSVVLRNHKKTD
ncbi:BsuBI/PstI family type II restriction endonuclease [Priestia megaterium]|uniref:BsuBI/PstI family type II restriction endonuclease n=1 Tax=Priestia megaterium TaxID=1404 RepID=UPI0039C422CC